MGRLGWPEWNELWRRFKEGETVREIAAGVGRGRSAVHKVIVGRGGVAPGPRRRAARALAWEDREEISRGLSSGKSFRMIARTIGSSPSTVSREVERNGGRSAYRALAADDAAWTRALRPKPCKLALHPTLCDLVAQQLTKDWSPEQISAWLRSEFPDDPTMQISHEAIYRTLFIQARGALKEQLKKHLRSHRAHRRSKKSEAKERTGIPDLVSIRERPAEVEDRAVPGHWEGDLIMGARNRSQIGTLVERKSRYVLLFHTKTKETSEVIAALSERIKTLPAHLRATLTLDRGSEFANHVEFTVATDVQVYFCDPHSPWQRGSNENTNGLLRQYFPKGRDLSNVTRAELDEVERRLNTRPRETLGWRTPAQVLGVALTG